jgi:class 3 adenylate cyclase
LPKRIVDTLKRRQDGIGHEVAMMADTSAVVVPSNYYCYFNQAGGTWPPPQVMIPEQGSGAFYNRTSMGGATASHALAEAFESATIMFADVVGFTKISSRVSPEQLVLLLNELFTVFDDLAERNGLEKIKTIGDAYMVAGGIPCPHPYHAQAIARMALQMIDSMQIFCDDRGNPLLLRIGIHSGSCVAGVIGRKKFIYDVWGDCVNTASRMESHGEPMKIHCSLQTAKRLRHDFALESRDRIDIRGKGLMHTFYVLDELPCSQQRSYMPLPVPVGVGNPEDGQIRTLRHKRRSGSITAKDDESHECGSSLRLDIDEDEDSEVF